MTKYLLDTNAVISLLNDQNSKVSNRVQQHLPAEICISSVVAHELYYGAFKSRHFDRNVAIVDNIQFTVLEFDKEDARQAGEIRAFLELQGRPIGSYDILIAGQARTRDLILITHNTKEFGRIKGLVVEDWEV